MIIKLKSSEEVGNFIMDILSLGGLTEESEGLWQCRSAHGIVYIDVVAHFPTVQRMILTHLQVPQRLDTINKLGKETKYEKLMKGV
jgi:hypothetical protein